MTKSNSIPQTISALFIEERERREISQAEMARALNVSAQWLDQVEGGQKPGADKLIQIFISTKADWVRPFCLDLLRGMYPKFPWPVLPKLNGKHPDP